MVIGFQDTVENVGDVFLGHSVVVWCVQAAGVGNRLPMALCVLSPVNEAMFYDQLLHAVENRLRLVNIDAAEDLLRTAYNSGLPKPSHEINIRTAVSTWQQFTRVIANSGCGHSH